MGKGTCPDPDEAARIEDSVHEPMVVTVTSRFEMDGSNVRNRLEYWVVRLPYHASVHIEAETVEDHPVHAVPAPCLVASWKENR